MAEAEKELEIAIKNTQAIFSKIISKPKCTNKLLSKPPFRFIHDIVTSTLKSTGFPNRYFTTQELDSNNFNEKASKVAFLEKLILLVSVAKGDPLDVKPSKVVAGLDPLNTNALLLAFGSIAIDETLQKDKLIAYCINGGKIGQIPPLKFISGDEEQASTSSNGADGQDTSQNQNSSANQSSEWESDIKHTQDILHSLISKPKCTDKLLGKPPFRFIHDVVIAVNRASTMGLENVLSENEMDSNKVRDKETKIEFLSKVIKVVEDNLGTVVDMKPSKVVAGLEVEKTRLFFQALVKAAKRSNEAKSNEKAINGKELTDILHHVNNDVAVTARKPYEENDSSNTAVVEGPKRILVNGGKESGEEAFLAGQHDGADFINSRSVDHDNMDRLKYEHDERTANAEHNIAGTSNIISKATFPEISIAHHGNRIEDIASPRTRKLVNARPKTARHIPRSSVKDETIDDMVTNTYHARPFTLFDHNQLSSTESSYKRTNTACNKGMIVQSKTAQDTESTLATNLTRPQYLPTSQNSKGNQADINRSVAPLKTTEYNTRAISESIQNIAKFVAAIVRMVEQFPEHTEKMSMEHNQWSAKYQALYRDLLAAKKATKEVLSPLETKISDIDDEILRFHQLISQRTMQIRQNNKWIRYRRCNST